MIEYSTVLILIFLTYLVAITNIKIPIFGFLIIFIDLMALLPEPLQTGLVVIGYTVSGSVATPIYQTFSWLTIVGVIGIVLCAVTFLLKMTGGLDW